MHPFFKSVPWKKMLNKEVDPPFRPRIEKGIYDVSNFDTKYTDILPTDSPVLSVDAISESQVRAPFFCYVVTHNPCPLARSVCRILVRPQLFSYFLFPF